MTKHFDYTNAMGLPKRLVVGDPKDGKYPCDLFEMRHGEWCGHGEMTREELNAYLEHFGITDQI